MGIDEKTPEVYIFTNFIFTSVKRHQHVKRLDDVATMLDSGQRFFVLLSSSGFSKPGKNWALQTIKTLKFRLMLSEFSNNPILLKISSVSWQYVPQGKCLWQYPSSSSIAFWIKFQYIEEFDIPFKMSHKLSRNWQIW